MNIAHKLPGIIALAAIIVFGMAACGSDTTYGAHEHSYGSAWQSNSTQHWHECSCGEKSNTANHITGSQWIVDSAATETVDGSRHKECVVCHHITETGIITATGADHNHIFGSSWNTNSIQHWHDCYCGVKNEIASHTGDPCPVCGYATDGGSPNIPDTIPPGDENTIYPVWTAYMSYTDFLIMTEEVGGDSLELSDKVWTHYDVSELEYNGSLNMFKQSGLSFTFNDMTENNWTVSQIKSHLTSIGIGSADVDNAVVAILTHDYISVFYRFGSYVNIISKSGPRTADFYCTPVSGGVEIRCYTATSKNVTIPSTLGGQAVVSIWGVATHQGSDTYHDGAFYRKDITSVTIPNSVKTIGPAAFRRNQLTNLTLPSGVSSIGEAAFSYNKISTLTIPGSVKTLEKRVFERNYLSKVIIQYGTTRISEEAFYFNLLEDVTIPNSVTTIENEAFSLNKLATIIIPDSVTTIGDDAFTCKLTSITIGANVDISKFSDCIGNIDEFHANNVHDNSGGGGLVFYSDNHFNDVYNDNGRQAGTYKRDNISSTVWTRY